MKVSILIPVKDEPYINKLVKEIGKYMSEYDHEIIVIEKSEHRSEIEGVKVVKQMTEGLAKAVVEGLRKARGNVIVIIDGDGSHRPRDIPRLLRWVDDYDIVIGSRFVKGGKTLDKAHRNFISLLYRKFASFVLGLDIKDNMSGFSVIKRGVLDEIKLNPIGYKINLEILYKAKKEGFKIKEVPIVFVSRKSGKSKRNIKVGLEILRHIIELRLEIR